MSVLRSISLATLSTFTVIYIGNVPISLKFNPLFERGGNPPPPRKTGLGKVPWGCGWPYKEGTPGPPRNVTDASESMLPKHCPWSSFIEGGKTKLVIPFTFAKATLPILAHRLFRRSLKVSLVKFGLPLNKSLAIDVTAVPISNSRITAVSYTHLTLPTKA